MKKEEIERVKQKLTDAIKEIDNCRYISAMYLLDHAHDIIIFNCGPEIQKYLQSRIKKK